jgi:hypothetical protein
MRIEVNNVFQHNCTAGNPILHTFSRRTVKRKLPDFSLYFVLIMVQSKKNPNFFLSSNLLHLTPYTSQITQS